DFFGERLIFPIFNIYDECIGFSARSLSPEARAKYKNSTNTLVFDKSKNLFGINVARKLKQKQKIDYVIVVEGQMDVIAMNKAGFENTVACLGTALTPDHAKAIKMISENVVVCLDGDSAGQKATFRTVDTLASAGLNVKAVKLPDNLDPDEYIDKYSAEEMKNVLDNAIDYVEFKIRYRLGEYDLDKHDEKAKFVNSALSIVRALETGSEKQIYLELIKKITGVPLDILKRDLGRVVENTTFGQVQEVSSAPSEDACQKAFKFIMASLLYKKPYANLEFDLSKYLINSSFSKLYEILRKAYLENKQVIISNLYDIFDMENEPNILSIINYNFEDIENLELYYNECVWKIRETYLKNNIQKLTEDFKKAESNEIRKEIALKLNNEQKKLKTKSLED
ncbi:MAG: toprim domain-containing protein, partial [Clostridia bacterium]|nr:toprim domain-containing protein [Clostridia bacterium]